MNLRAQILKEHTKANCLLITTYVGSDKKRFAHLISAYLAGPYRVTQRAAWPVSYCVQHHPELIIPHLKKMLDFVVKPGVPGAVKRNTMRLLQFIEVPKKFQGYVVKICFDLLNDKKEAIAVQVFAMTVLANIAQQEPALADELIMLIEDRLPFASAGFRSRANKLLKRLKNL